MMAKFDDGKLKKLQAIHNYGIMIRLNSVDGIVPRFDALDLFVLALDDLQRDTNSHDRMGYFQIVG